jgi:hypothetical protein
MSPKQFIGFLSGDYKPSEIYGFMIDYAKLKCLEQRHICQIEMDKDSICDENDKWFVSCDDVLNADEPAFNDISQIEINNLLKAYEEYKEKK